MKKLLFIITTIFFSTTTISVFGQWEEIYTYDNISPIIKFSSVDSVIIIGTKDSIIASKDNGDNWSRIDTITDSENTYIYQDAYVIAFVDNYSHLYYSKDNGKTWISPDLESPIFSCLFYNNNIIYESYYRMKSLKNLINYFDYEIGDCNIAHGEYCTQFSTNGTLIAKNGSSIFANMRLETIENHAITESEDLGFYKSWDEGVHWTKLNISPEQIDFSYPYMYVDNGTSLEISSDFGASFTTSLQENLDYFKALDNNIIGAKDNSIFLSTDYGKTWQTLNNEDGFHVFSINNKYLYATSNMKIYRKSLDLYPLSISNKNENLIKIYPNPTKKFIQIESPSLINEITISNNQGTVVHSYKNYSLQKLDISDLTKGIYFITIKTVDEKLYIEKIVKE